MEKNIARNRYHFLYLFLEKGPIHGLPYIIKRKLTFFERSVWFILTLTALCLSIDLALESLTRYKTKSTVISVEKDFQNWNTTYPSITICPMERISPEKFKAYCANHGIERKIYGELFSFLESLANSSYFNFNDIKDYPNTTHKIEPKNYMNLIYNLTENYLNVPSHMDPPQARWDIWIIHSQQVLTEWGICYTANNLLNDDLSVKKLLFKQPADSISHEKENFMRILKMHIYDESAGLSFMGFKGKVQVFLHGIDEVMKLKKRLPQWSSLPLEFEVKMMEITSTSQFEKSTTVEQRKCRSPYESNLKHFPVYSRNLCRQECRINLAYKLCKCIPHFYPNLNAIKPVCHYKVLRDCLSKYAGVFENLKDINKLSISKEKLQCHCLPNCRISEIVETEWKPMEYADTFLGSGSILLMKSFPRLRYRRQIIFTMTDLLVSIGGSAGFFLGFSVLSAIEIIYYFSVRLIWHYLNYKE